jgi:hypothetical protein
MAQTSIGFTTPNFRRYGFTTIVFLLIFASNILSQRNLSSIFIPDSVINRFGITHVEEHGFANLGDTAPSWSTMEDFDTTGRLIKRVSTNYSDAKFVENYFFNKKTQQTIVSIQKLDWNPSREKNRGDTISSKTAERYDHKPKKNSRLKGIEKFVTKNTFDSSGRIIMSIDTIKCGYLTQRFEYDLNGQLFRRLKYDTHHGEPPQLLEIMTWEYDGNGQIAREISYIGFKENDGAIGQHSKEVKKENSYNELGLLKERVIASRSMSSPLTVRPQVYKYSYRFERMPK